MRREGGYSDEGDIFQRDAVYRWCPLIHSDGYAFVLPLNSIPRRQRTDQESDFQPLLENGDGDDGDVGRELGMECSV